jgi:hypothetical protein
MKKCPFCAEEIQDAAVACKHCGRDLMPVKPAAAKARWGRSIRTRNWVYVALAYAVSFWLVRIEPSRPANDPTYLVMIEALGFMLACAVPAFAMQVWRKERRAYHLWTLAIALLLAEGGWYGATHPVTSRELPTEHRAQVVSQAESAVPNKAPHLTVLISSQSSEGVKQADMSQAFLKNLETYTVERARKKTEEYLASTGNAGNKVNVRSEANYIESNGTKLAVIRVTTQTEFNSVFILGIVGTELKRVLCAIEVDQAVAISYGECSDAIRRTFGVDLAASG